MARASSIDAPSFAVGCLWGIVAALVGLGAFAVAVVLLLAFTP